MRTWISIAALILCTGCTHRLPNIKAEAINQTVAFPGFTSTVDASGISITDATIRAADVSWRVSAMGFNSVTTAKGYQQKREKEMPDR
jgi:hypothetical protein